MKKSWFKEFKFKIGIVCRLYNFNGIVDNSFKFLIIETKKKKNKREKLKYRLLHLRSTTLIFKFFKYTSKYFVKLSESFFSNKKINKLLIKNAFD